jgi:hypothetical protein
MSLSPAGALFWIAVASCAVAQVAIIRSVVASPRKRAIELAWAILPAFALAAVLLLTWRRLHP